MRFSLRLRSRGWASVTTGVVTIGVVAGLTVLSPRLSEPTATSSPDPLSVGAARRSELSTSTTSPTPPEAPVATPAPILTASTTTTSAAAGSTAPGSTAGRALGNASTGPTPAPTVAPPAPPPTRAPATPAPTTAAPAPTTAAPAASEGLRCFVRLHGKSGYGQPTTIDGDGVTVVSPTGNADGWGGRQWLYYPESGYQSARSIVANAVSITGCGRVVLYGFSNGAAFAAKLLCRGETFGGRLVGVIIDDPVTDHAVEGCARASGVRVALYTTGAIDMPAGWDCASGDWTCEGGTTIGIAAYQGALGVTHKASIHTDHQGWETPPERNAWW
jgi:hypothetical protein